MVDAANGVLTEVGTNELEVVEFLIAGHPYVINVAKVREIIRPHATMPVPQSHPCVLGLFRNREEVLPLVDLGKWLGVEAELDAGQAKIIVTEFNGKRVGFLVHRVSRIHRVGWTDFEAPGPDSMAASPSTLGLMRLGRGSHESERIVLLLDFERIVAELSGTYSQEAADAHTPGGETENRVVLIAEDSELARKAVGEALGRAGYHVIQATNGQEAWDRLTSGECVDAVVTDIEMPRMDGHHLTRRIKADGRFRRIPVILYSSMIHEEMRRKGETLGADAQVCKPDLPHLLQAVNQLLSS
jgi:two-component system chemotaxis response regulator CheV